MSNRFTPAALPFVGQEKSTKQRSFWNVPATGNYAEGTTIGMAMAAAYIAYLSGSDSLPPILPQIILDMTASADLSDALHGQLVGFCSALELALRQRTPSPPSTILGNKG
ncbi:hypothetical protein AAKU55_005727 [Oxalobacteraceae bacterium GrIS 1.11]